MGPPVRVRVSVRVRIRIWVRVRVRARVRVRVGTMPRTSQPGKDQDRNRATSGVRVGVRER